MGLRAGLDWCGKSRPTGIRYPDRPARRQSLYRLRYPAHSCQNKFVKLVHLDGFIIKKFVAIHGTMNVTLLYIHKKSLIHYYINNIH